MRRRSITKIVAEQLLALLSPEAEVSFEPLPSSPSRRILFAKIYGMGDGVMIRSIIEHLRRRNNFEAIGVLVSPQTRDVMSCASNFRIHFYDPNGSSLKMLLLLKQIRDCGYETVLDLEPTSLLVAAFIRLSSIPTRIGFCGGHGDRRNWLRTHAVRLNESESVWKSFLRISRVIDPSLSECASTVPLPCGDEERRAIDEWWARETPPGAFAVALHIGTGAWAPFRRWPVERFVALAEQLRQDISEMVVILIGTRSDRTLIEIFSSEFHGRILDASELGSIQRTALTLERCRLFIGNDSGVMHLAAAMGTPTLGLFGANTPKHWAPVGSCASSLYLTKVSCSPCINTFRSISPSACIHQEERRCMLDISVTQVREAIRHVIARAAAHSANGEQRCGVK